MMSAALFHHALPDMMFCLRHKVMGPKQSWATTSEIKSQNKFFLFFFFFFFVVMGFEFKAYTFSHSTSPFLL
jgi:hypothetical protein